MGSMFQTEQLCIMLLLREALTGQKNRKENKAFPWKQVDWEKFLELAESHNVLSLLYDVLEEWKKYQSAQLCKATACSLPAII